MERPFQASLLDLADEVQPGDLGSGLRRSELGAGAWVDVLPGWVRGADLLFGRLERVVAWQAERRFMYDRMVDVPRLVCFYGDGEPLPDPALADLMSRLSDHYQAELGERFRTVGLCFYRDGRDSVAWHGDTIGRGATEDTMVAIVSLGAPRALLLRRRGGGRPDRGSASSSARPGSAERGTGYPALRGSALPGVACVPGFPAFRRSRVRCAILAICALRRCSLPSRTRLSSVRLPLVWRGAFCLAGSTGGVSYLITCEEP